MLKRARSPDRSFQSRGKFLNRFYFCLIVGCSNYTKIKPVRKFPRIRYTSWTIWVAFWDWVQIPKIRDCPRDSGTVGAYALAWTLQLPQTGWTHKHTHTHWYHTQLQTQPHSIGYYPAATSVAVQAAFPPTFPTPPHTPSLPTGFTSTRLGQQESHTRASYLEGGTEGEMLNTCFQTIWQAYSIAITGWTWCCTLLPATSYTSCNPQQHTP